MSWREGREKRETASETRTKITIRQVERGNRSMMFELSEEGDLLGHSQFSVAEIETLQHLL